MSRLLLLVVDKHAALQAEVQIKDGDLQYDFGNLSLTEFVLNLFEDGLFEKLTDGGEQVVAEAVANLNHKLDGLDEYGLPDPTIEAFNGRTAFVLDLSEIDQEFVENLLRELGLPEVVLALIDDRGIEILLQLAMLDDAEREAYLAALGVEVSCTVLLDAFEKPLDATPIYALNGGNCEIADPAGPDAGRYFSDTSCSTELAFRPTDVGEFCSTRFGEGSETLLGNAAAWAPETNQPNDPLPEIPSLPWTTTPSTKLDIGVVSLQGNHQPYMKQFHYKTELDLPRGNGSCELEMRVYKKDIAEQGLKPLLAIHGGSWRYRGFGFFGMEALISHLTERGFVVFAPFYRLVGESDGNIECNGADWRALVDDVESALGWVGEYGPALGATDGPVSVYGQSAGAHLAAWLAAHRPDDVRKALLYYGPTDALEFLSGAVPLGGPYEEFRDFGLKSLTQLYGAHNGVAEVQLDQVNFAGVDAATLSENWDTLIPDTVFNLTMIDPMDPPAYVRRCAEETQTDLSAINLALPPAEMTLCMKQDLSEFLVNNSFNDFLSDGVVPVHTVHGSGDTLVPHAQAVSLCGAIAHSVLSTDVFLPLTSYECGTESQAQIIKDAEHMLELGVCLGSVCPAGQPGSPTREAVVTAIHTSYFWLRENSSAADPSLPPENNVPPEPSSGGGALNWLILVNLLVVCVLSNLRTHCGRFQVF